MSIDAFIAFHSFTRISLQNTFLGHSFVLRMLVNAFHCSRNAHLGHPFICSLLVHASRWLQMYLFRPLICVQYVRSSCSPKMLFRPLNHLEYVSVVPLVSQNGHSGHLFVYHVLGDASLWLPKCSLRPLVSCQGARLQVSK